MARRRGSACRQRIRPGRPTRPRRDGCRRTGLSMTRPEGRTAPNRSIAPTTPSNPSCGPCPLCSNTSATLVAAIEYSRIWHRLESDFRVRFPREVVERHTPVSVARLWQCATCGLQYFSPVVPGDNGFWGVLSAADQAFYHTDKPEFRAVLERIRPGMRVLDVGCGLGTFVQAASQLGAVATGLEQNLTAASSARAQGIDVRAETIQDFSVGRAGTFDVVTMFQVIEHVQPILPFAKAAYACLKPGGFLFVCAPYRHRLRPAGFEVLDHPPHHVSRWDTEPIYWLTTNLGASVSVEFDHLSEREALGFRVGRVFAAETGVRRRVRNTLMKLAWLVTFLALPGRFALACAGVAGWTATATRSQPSFRNRDYRQTPSRIESRMLDRVQYPLS